MKIREVVTTIIANTTSSPSPSSSQPSDEPVITSPVFAAPPPSISLPDLLRRLLVDRPLSGLEIVAGFCVTAIFLIGLITLIGCCVGRCRRRRSLAGAYKPVAAAAYQAAFLTASEESTPFHATPAPEPTTTGFGGGGGSAAAVAPASL
jgi:hypothetical protein